MHAAPNSREEIRQQLRFERSHYRTGMEPATAILATSGALSASGKSVRRAAYNRGTDRRIARSGTSLQFLSAVRKVQIRPSLPREVAKFQGQDQGLEPYRVRHNT